MSEKLLNRNDIAALLKTTPDIAASILAEHNVHLINLGIGRSRGLRWLESAVVYVLKKLHAAAQPQPRPNKKPKVNNGIMECSLSDMSAKDIYNLTHTQPVQ